MAIVAGIVMAAMAVASSIKQNNEAKQQAKANAQAQKNAWELQKADTRENYRQLAMNDQEINQEYKENLVSNQTSLAQQKAQVELMAAASGTGGAAINSMMTDLNTTAGQNQANIVSNYEKEQQSLVNQYRSAQKGGAMEMRTFRKPSATDYITSGANAGVQGFLGGYTAGKGLQSAYNDWRTPSTIKTN